MMFKKKYTYQNNEGKTCTIMSKSVKFIPKEQLNNLILLDEPNTDGYKFINEDKLDLIMENYRGIFLLMNY